MQRLKNSFKLIHKSFLKINGCVHSVERNSRVQILFENIFSTNTLKRYENYVRFI